MTDEEALKDAGYTDEEISDMSEMGRQISKFQNVSELDALTQSYLDHDMIDDAERILALKNDAVDYVKNTINEITGWIVEYNDNVGQFYNTANGQFMGKFSFDRNLTDDQYEQAIINKFGVNPI